MIYVAVDRYYSIKIRYDPSSFANFQWSFPFSVILYLNLIMLLQPLLLIAFLYIYLFIRMMSDWYLRTLRLVACLFLHAAGEEEKSHIHHKDDATNIHLFISYWEGEVMWLSHHSYCQKRLYIFTLTKKIKPYMETMFIILVHFI